MRYLSRYVHRIAISSSRVVSYDGRTVVFRYKDRKEGRVKTRSVSGRDFARAFLEHVLPEAFVRIRHFGLHASRRRNDLARCRRLIGAPAVPISQKETWVEAFRRLLGTEALLCPRCGKADMVIVKTLRPLSP